MPGVVIVIPTYNEAQNIVPIITRVREFLPQVRIMVVDDNSPDGTGNIVRDLMASDPNLSLFARAGKEGLGKAYLAAFEELLKDPSVTWIEMLDADFSHDPKYLPRMFEAAQHADVVIGSRYIEGGGTKGWPLWRRWLSRFANRYCRIITGLPVRDCTSGFNLMRASVMRDAQFNQVRSSGHAFLVELKYRLWRHGARFIEVPVRLEDRQQGASKMSGGVVGEAMVAPWKMRFSKL